VHRSGKSTATPTLQAETTLPRGLFFLILLAILVIGALFFLSRQATEVPRTTIEANVTANATSN
jgi:hypothetical protein